MSIDEKIAPVSAPAARIRGIEMKFHPCSHRIVRPCVPVGETVGVMVVVGIAVVTVVTGVVGGHIVCVGVGVCVVAVVIGVVVGTVVCVCVGVGVTVPNKSVRFCADPDWY